MLENYPKAIQKAAYKTFKGLNGNQWKILVSYKKKSVDKILYIQDMTKNVYISGLFPLDLENNLFYFDIRYTAMKYCLDSSDPNHIVITEMIKPESLQRLANVIASNPEAVHA